MPGAARPTATLLVVSAAAFLSSLDLFIVNIAFPGIRADFPGSSLADLSWVLNAYTVVFAAFLAPAGRLADRVGPRRVFLVGLAVFTVASAACAAAPALGLLVAARVVQAVGAALLVPTSLTLLLGAYPPAERTRAVGTWASIGAVAAALGPPLGGALVELSWHWVFLVNVPVGVVALVAGVRVLRESPTAASGLPDLLGAVGLVVGIGAVAYGLVRAPDAGWASVEVLGSGALALVALTLVVRRAGRHPVPALDLTVLRVPALALGATTMLLFTAGFAAMLIVNVLLLTGTWGWSTGRAGFALMAGPLVVVVVARVAGRVSARLGTGMTAALGAGSFGVGAGLWFVLLGPEPHFTLLLAGQLLTGLGVGLILPTLSAVVGSALPPTRWGSGSALINTARQAGAVLGVAVVVSVMGTSTTGAPGELDLLRHGWAMLVVAAGLAALVALGLARAERRVAPSAPAAVPPAARAGETR